MAGITAQKPWQAIRLVSPFFRRYRKGLAIGFLALLSVDFLQLLIPRVIKRAIDLLQAGEATQEALLRHGAVIVSLALAIAGCRFCWRYCILGFSRRLEKELRQWFFNHLLTLDRPFFQHRSTGELMALATNDLAAVQLACGMGLVASVDALMMTLAALGFMAYIHPTLTMIAVVPMPVLAILTRLLAARLHRRFKKVQEQFSLLTEFARSTFSSMRLIKAYTQERYQADCFDRLGQDYVRDNLKLAMVQGALFPFSGLIANASLLLVLFFGGRLTIQATITAGDFVAFITYLLMLTWPMMAIGWVVNLFQRGVTSLGRLQAVLDERPLVRDAEVIQQLPLLVSTMSVKRLTFAYDSQLPPVLNNLSIEIRPGVLGVVGRSGSGKTTLCQLLARLYPVAAGRIFLENIDVNNLPLTLVRGSIAYVPQEVILFSESIGANIGMGRPGASQTEIEEVAKVAAIHEEIMAMPQGYATRIGERGVALSGGQRQRLALARALLLQHPIIIIDDGLSAVDIQTEHAIIRSLATYLKGRSCLIVSHRVAPLIEADSIVVMDEGMIRARGDHGQLLETSEYYRTIFRHQMAAYPEPVAEPSTIYKVGD